MVPAVADDDRRLVFQQPFQHPGGDERAPLVKDQQADVFERHRADQYAFALDTELLVLHAQIGGG